MKKNQKRIFKAFLILGYLFFVSTSLKAKKEADTLPYGAREVSGLKIPHLGKQSAAQEPSAVASADAKSFGAILPEKIVLKKASLSKDEYRTAQRELANLSRYRDAKSMDAEELRRAADLSIQLCKADRALTYLKQIAAGSKDSETIERVKLEIADLLFDQQLFEKATVAYTEYLDLYPGSSNAEDAHYRKTVCLSKRVLSLDQDQAITREALALAESYVEKGSVYKKYTKEIETIRQDCYTLLCHSEIDTFNFYLKKESYDAANSRLVYARSQYVPKLPTLESDILQGECRLALAQGKTEKYNERLALLEKKFPETNSGIKVAQAPKKSYTTQF